MTGRCREVSGVWRGGGGRRVGDGEGEEEEKDEWGMARWGKREVS